jgi:site-specific DNA-methyltransferase (adenine-specific)
MQEYLNKIINDDCLSFMAKLPDNFIDLTITSPPYDNLRDYKNDICKIYNFEVFKLIAKELYRITKNGGVVVWVVGDATINGSETGTSFKQALYFKEIGFNLHDTMIYQKNAYPFPPVNRYFPVFEFMFIISKKNPKTYNLIRVMTHSQRNNNSSTRNKDGSLSKTKYEVGKKTRIKDNIWLYNIGFSKSSKDKIAYEHPAIFPEKLASDHIVSWSNKGDIVFDPFMGSGTTAKMAIANDRNFIGCEISKEYCKIAETRIKAEQAQGKLNLV